MHFSATFLVYFAAIAKSLCRLLLLDPHALRFCVALSFPSVLFAYFNYSDSHSHSNFILVFLLSLQFT